MYWVIGMLVFPASFIYEGYTDFKREIKDIQPDGSFELKEVTDDVFSGFQSITIPCEEIYIPDAYTHDIQKQSCVIWKRIIPYASAMIKYGTNPNFKYVQSGIRYFYNNDNRIYEQQESSFEEYNVEEVVYYNRVSDLELRL